MRLVDTSAWIEWIANTPTGDDINAELPSREEWLVPTVVQLELAKWLRREGGDEKTDRIIAFSETCMVADLDTEIALAAADFCASHKLATADAIIYATARAYGADLLTCDRHFEGLPAVLFIPKSQAER